MNIRKLTFAIIAYVFLTTGLANAQTIREVEALDTPTGQLSCEKPSAVFPYEHKYVRVNGVKIAYVEAGQGDPIILTHGNPTSSYMWRNVIPELAKHGRVIAFDAAGHGKSDLPPKAYGLADYISSLEGFIEAKQLKNVTLVMNDWLAGVAGFDYGRRHEKNVKAIVFIDTVMGPRFPSEFEDISMPFQGFMRTAKTAEFRKSVLDGKVFPGNMNSEPCGISAAAFENYAASLQQAGRLEVIYTYPKLVPVGPDREGEEADIVRQYSQWLQGSELPKLLLLGEFGVILDHASAGELLKITPNLSVATVKSGMHYLAETHPNKVSREIGHWYTELSR